MTYLAACNTLSAAEIAMCLAADPRWTLPAWSHDGRARMAEALAVLREIAAENCTQATAATAADVEAGVAA